MPIKPAFSAVELLLVAGISAILVAIAVPGYMEAKARAETVDVMKSLREVENAIVQYKVDYNNYPEPAYSFASHNPLRRLVDTELISFEPEDRFKKGLRNYGGYYAEHYLNFGFLTPDKKEYLPTLVRVNKAAALASGTNPGLLVNRRYWFVKSIGPDQTDWHDEGGERNSNKSNRLGMVQYDPTNGVFSLGEIFFNPRSF